MYDRCIKRKSTIQLATGWLVWVRTKDDEMYFNISVTTLLAIHIPMPIFSYSWCIQENVYKGSISPENE